MIKVTKEFIENSEFISEYLTRLVKELNVVVDEYNRLSQDFPSDMPIEDIAEQVFKLNYLESRIDYLRDTIIQCRLIENKKEAK